MDLNRSSMTSPFGYFRALAKILIFALGLITLNISWTWAFETLGPSTSNSDAILGHVRYLASDKLMGRDVDTPGIQLARDYIAQEFNKYGLFPGGRDGSYFQEVDVVTEVRVKKESNFSLEKHSPLVLNEDWIPLGFSHSGSIEGELVFVGYGITDKNFGFDDYAGVDVKGKIVLVLRYEPPPKNEKSPFRHYPRYSHHAELRTKAANAHSHGAIGMILLNLDPSRKGKKELISINRSLMQIDGTLIAAQVKYQNMEKWLQAEGVYLHELKEKIDREEKPASSHLPGLRASLSVSLEKKIKKSDNVVGILTGSDPLLKKENIVIGAHYDHVGLGHFGTPDSNYEGQIHNGADDNASGTAVILKLAERLSRLPNRLPRSIIFIAFTGEERGLYGSRYYVSHPHSPMESTKAMLNLDMVGRIKDNRITVGGIGTAKEFSDLITEAAHSVGLEIARFRREIGRSDHRSFYERNIPVLHFFTGLHKDYHRPTDDWEKLNIEGLAKVSHLVLAIAGKLASSKDLFAFVRSQHSAGEPRPSHSTAHPTPDN